MYVCMCLHVCMFVHMSVYVSVNVYMCALLLFYWYGYHRLYCDNIIFGFGRRG